MDGERKLLEPGQQHLGVLLSLLRVELLGSVAMETRPWVGGHSPLLILALHLQPEAQAPVFTLPPQDTSSPHP